MATNSDEVPSSPPQANGSTETDVTETPVPVENESTQEVDPSAADPTSNEEKNEDVTPVEDTTAAASSTEAMPADDSQADPTGSTSLDQQEDTAVSKSAETQQASADPVEKPRAASSKSRSVNFSSTDENDVETTAKSRGTSSSATRSSYKPSRRSVDFIDTLVESYKLETSNNDPIVKEEKKYVPKTSRSRLNPNWREHRTRRLMNKLEELSLWDREEEMKAAQAQALRDQKWEQIQDRQRNHDLCLNLMRQRHESEMESAVILDRRANGINDENMNATIARTMKLAGSTNNLGYDAPLTPSTLRRRAKKEEETPVDMKTPIGRYRQFENNMSEKVEKINQKLQPDREIMRAYSPYRTSIPASAVPLFSETYAALLSVPDTHSSNKYNQYHYGVASYLHQPHHASSPDFETRLRAHSNRDVRVPLKEQANDYNFRDDDFSHNHNRSLALDDDQYSKPRSNVTEDDYYPSKYRLSTLDEDYPLKSRSTGLDDDYPSKYRSSVLDDDHLSKYRSTAVEEDYPSVYRPYSSADDDYLGKYRPNQPSRLGYSPPRRTTSMASPTASALYDYSTVSNTPRDFSFLHARQPTSSSIHHRSLNDDLNAITRFSTETTKKILQNVTDGPLSPASKPRSSGKHVSFSERERNFSGADEDLDYEYNGNSTHASRHYASKPTYPPVEILSLSSTR